MTTFSNAPATLPRQGPLDPTKHVNYTLGMVLGVDDFTQEFTYVTARDRWLARDAVGYGTLWGLGVTMDLGDDGPRVTVAPGAGLTPCGQLVCVTPAQCADVNPWLAANTTEVRNAVGAGSSTLTAYAVLCYRECATDEVPIPGEPCRTEGELKAPSRLKDDFRLELRTERPLQLEDDAVVDFVSWLRSIEVVDSGGTPLPDFVEEIRRAAAEAREWLGSPPHSPPDLSPPGSAFDFLTGSPPGGLAIPRARVREYIDAAFRLWTTELRPFLRVAVPGCEQGCGCGCDGVHPQGDACSDELLLAELTLPLAPGFLQVSDTGWFADQRTRPYVVHTRLLQEWLLAGAAGEGFGFPIGSPPAGPGGSTIVSASAETVSAGSPAEATLNPATGDVHFRIPEGPAGVETVSAEELPAGSAPAVALDSARNLHLKIPAGASGSGVSSVSVVAGRAGSPPGVAFDPATGNVELTIPPGPAGTSVDSASAETVAAGVAAAASFDASIGNVHFRIPQGPAGAAGTSVRSATAVTRAAGSGATATFNATNGLLTLGIPQGDAGAPAAGALLVAGGEYQPDGSPLFEFGRTRVTLLDEGLLGPPTSSVYHIAFGAFSPARRFLITGTPHAQLGVGERSFEVLPAEGRGGFPPGTEEAAGAARIAPDSGIFVRITGRDESAAKFGFQFQIVDVSAVIR